MREAMSLWGNDMDVFALVLANHVHHGSCILDGHFEQSNSQIQISL